MDSSAFHKLALAAFPGSLVPKFEPYWKECLEYAEINTRDRANMFLAQVGHECAKFTRLVENLNYKADRMAQIWPGIYGVRDNLKVLVKVGNKYPPNDLAHSLVGDPEAIANHSYANKLGNGTIASGDGWKYRGRGLIMNTGKAQYILLTKALWPILGIDFKENPHLLAEPKNALWGAVWYWKINGLNKPSDLGVAGVSSATRIINGKAMAGLRDRQDLYNRICIIKI